MRAIEKLGIVYGNGGNLRNGREGGGVGGLERHSGGDASCARMMSGWRREEYGGSRTELDTYKHRVAPAARQTPGVSTFLSDGEESENVYAAMVVPWIIGGRGSGKESP